MVSRLPSSALTVPNVQLRFGTSTVAVTVNALAPALTRLAPVHEADVTAKPDGTSRFNVNPGTRLGSGSVDRETELPPNGGLRSSVSSGSP